MTLFDALKLRHGRQINGSHELDRYGTGAVWYWTKNKLVVWSARLDKDGEPAADGRRHILAIAR